MTIREAIATANNELKKIYTEGEAASITELLIEHITGTQKSRRATESDQSLPGSHIEQLQKSILRLLDHEPIQYVINEAWFCGLKFYVDKNVLIPRPETEELVEWIITNCKFPLDDLKILDIGTGSGCIPIALKRRLRKAEVWSCDSSEPELEVAKRNARTLGTEINFRHLDFLDKNNWNSFPQFDIIVSNPPYIPEKEKYSMPENVVAYEPRIALFVPDNDPMLFYKAIAEFGKEHLKPGGTIYTEIHESQGEAATDVFRSFGYESEIKKDMQGKDRMIRSTIISHKDH